MGKIKMILASDVAGGNLTEAEWVELVTLDYIICWRYTYDMQKDLERQKELRKKRYAK
tara:strand:+ start:73 stop:246 length:174 start_codon:yes stop_codon:yes gene_type:complete